MKTMRKLFLGLALCTALAASAHALTVAEVLQNSTEYVGKIATVSLPRGWKKGTFDSTSWLDFKAPVGSVTSKTIRFDKKSLFAHSEEEFERKVAEMAAKEQVPLQTFTIDDVLFIGWAVPSRSQNRSVRGVKYDLRLYADWPRKEQPRPNEYRDAMLLEVNERPLLGPEDRPRIRPEQIGELYAAGMLPDVEVMALLSSIRFADSEGRRYHARFAQMRHDAQAAANAADAVLKMAAMGRLVGTWKPVELRWNGRSLTGDEMREAAGARLRTIVFNSDGIYVIAPRDETWRVNERGGYTLGDASGRLWVENNGLVNFRDADGYHFIFRKEPNEFPSDAELLAIALGDWTPVELIREGRAYLGNEFARAASLARVPASPISVRPDGTLYDGRKFGTWTLGSASIAFSLDGYRLSVRGDHIENADANGTRVIYARKGEEIRHRSVFMREQLQAEALAAESEPIIGVWTPDTVEERGAELPRSARTESILSVIRPLHFAASGDITIENRVVGKWRNDGGVYIIELREGAKTPQMNYTSGARLTRAYNDTTEIVYKKEPFRY